MYKRPPARPRRSSRTTALFRTSSLHASDSPPPRRPINPLLTSHQATSVSDASSVSSSQADSEADARYRGLSVSNAGPTSADVTLLDSLAQFRRLEDQVMHVRGAFHMKSLVDDMHELLTRRPRIASSVDRGHVTKVGRMARSLVGSDAWHDLIEPEWTRLLARFQEDVPSQLEVGSRGSHLLSAAFGAYPKGSSPQASVAEPAGRPARSPRKRPGLSLRLGGGGEATSGVAGCFSPTHGPSRGGHTPRAAAAAAARRQRLAAEATAAAPAPNEPVSILSFDAATPTRVMHLTFPDESPVVERRAGTSPRSRARAAALRAEAAAAGTATAVVERSAGTSPRSRRAAEVKRWELETGSEGSRLQEALKMRHEERSSTPDNAKPRVGNSASLGRQTARGARALPSAGTGSVSLSPAQSLGRNFDSSDLGSSGAWSDSGGDSPRYDGPLSGTTASGGSPLRHSYTPPAPRGGDSLDGGALDDSGNDETDIVVAETYVGAGMQGLPMYDPETSQQQSMAVGVTRDGTFAGIKKKKVANFSSRQAEAKVGAAADAERFEAARMVAAGAVFGARDEGEGAG